MNGFALLYGRNGQQVSGDPHVAELLPRTVDGQSRATDELLKLQSTLDFTSAQRWVLPATDTTMLHKLWLSEMCWQMATAYLDGVVEQYESIDQLPDAPYQECDDLCDVASSATLQAIQFRSKIAQGANLQSDTLMTLPTLQTTGYGYVGVWRALEAIYLQVSEDVRALQSIEVPLRMAAVNKAIALTAQPQLDSFEFIQSTWRTAKSEHNRQQVVSEASSVAATLFTIGQQLCNMHLLGSVYAEALAYKPTLQELNLSFDPWLLTDPTIIAQKRNDKPSQQELAGFWESVVDRAAAQQVARDIEAAVKARRIRLRTGQGYKSVPWPAQYMVRFAITFGPRSFEPGQLIAVYVNQDDTGSSAVEVRRTGRLLTVHDMLGQPS